MALKVQGRGRLTCRRGMKEWAIGITRRQYMAWLPTKNIVFIGWVYIIMTTVYWSVYKGPSCFWIL